MPGGGWGGVDGGGLPLPATRQATNGTHGGPTEGPPGLAPQARAVAAALGTGAVAEVRRSKASWQHLAGCQVLQKGRAPCGPGEVLGGAVRRGGRANHCGHRPGSHALPKELRTVSREVAASLANVRRAAPPVVPMRPRARRTSASWLKAPSWSPAPCRCRRVAAAPGRSWTEALRQAR